MRSRLNSEVKKAGGLRAWAREHGVAVSQVSKTLAGTIPAPPMVLAALGLCRVISYQKVDP